MAKLLIFVALSLFGFAFARYQVRDEFFEEPYEIEGRLISQNLYIDNPYHDAGKWGEVALCVDGSFAFAVEVTYNPPGNLDETAINGIKLYCKTPEGHDTGYITSDVGPSGQTYGMQICSADFVTGFRANVLEYQGGFTDDVAVQDFEVECNYGPEIVDGLPITVPKFAETQNFKPGTWSSLAKCNAGLAVCGLQTRIEDGALGDETAVCDVVLFCCERPVGTSPPL